MICSDCDKVFEYEPIVLDTDISSLSYFEINGLIMGYDLTINKVDLCHRCVIGRIEKLLHD